MGAGLSQTPAGEPASLQRSPWHQRCPAFLTNSTFLGFFYKHTSQFFPLRVVAFGLSSPSLGNLGSCLLVPTVPVLPNPLHLPQPGADLGACRLIGSLI